jgi:fructosamine-3-kinase
MTWAEYFIEYRLKHMLRHPRLSSHQELHDKFDKAEPSIRKALEQVKEPPSLVHGDLWSGNYLCAEGQVPVLIDPAPYCGHREVDLAMSELFGGYDQEFYEAYDQRLPLMKGYEQRKHIYNLYHVLNHWISFGGSYSGQALSILESTSRLS